MSIRNKVIVAGFMGFICSGCYSYDSGQDVPPTPTATIEALSPPVPPNIPGAQTATLTVQNSRSASATPPTLADPKILAELRGLAMNVSAASLVTAPKKMRVVAAVDHQDAERTLSGATVNDHAPVYVITVTGGPFTAVHHGHGSAAPRGNVLTLTIDAATRTVTDIGYVDAEPDLNKLGGAPIDL